MQIRNRSRRFSLAVFASLCILTAGDRVDSRVEADQVFFQHEHERHSSVYDVRAFGAKGDGKALDTSFINKAIEEAAINGGGTVWFPAGSYLSVSIHLKSNITLYLDSGATIIAANPSEGFRYDSPEPNAWDKYDDFGHMHWHNSLMWGENLENVSILGPGRIWGKALVRDGSQSRTQEQNEALSKILIDPTSAPFGFPDPRDSVEDGWANKVIALKLCRNIIIRDISILHGGHFGILATGVDNLTIDDVKIDTNRDGINIDACRQVHISNCSVNSPYDDGICLKSSYALGYARATEDVTITNCHLSGFDPGTLLAGTYQGEPLIDNRVRKNGQRRYGRIKLGTESNGGFKRITISNCVFDHCRGLALESVDGGVLEDVTINNLVMRDITDSPLFLRLGFRGRGPRETTTVGALRRVTIGNVIVYNADPKYASIISGIPGHQIEDVSLSNVHIYYQGGGTREQSLVELPENEGDYPSPEMFGQPTPSYGFFIRHVKGLRMNDLKVSYMKEEVRPAFVLNDVVDAKFCWLQAQHATDTPTLMFRKVKNLRIQQSWPLADIWLNAVKPGRL